MRTSSLSIQNLFRPCVHGTDVFERDLDLDLVEIEEENPLIGHGDEACLDALGALGDADEGFSFPEVVGESRELVPRQPAPFERIARRGVDGSRPLFELAFHRNDEVVADAGVDLPDDLGATPPEVGLDLEREAVLAPEHPPSVNPAQHGAALGEENRDGLVAGRDK